MDVLLLIVSICLIVAGADWLVAGASSMARKAGVSEFVIGLTIVGFGTSCPELVVSLTGAFHGNADVAVGNVVGSNIFNVLFILGITALLFPVTMTESNRRKDIPVTLAVTIVLLLFGMSSTLLGLGCR
ncbi:MAG: sodium:calcium antiporter [Candidatus Cryptobacteroides sp.]